MRATLTRLTQVTGEPQSAGDGPLLDAFLAGDESAFALLVRRHAGLVFATCRRVLRHQQDAEDAFQATFLVLARRAADVWPREAVASWLFGVAHRVALKARAVRSRRAARVQPLEDVARAGPPAPDFDLAEAVHRVVCKLPEAYRAAVVACDLEGLSRKEAAERLGWPEGTLSGRLARARELLANRLRRAGLALSAGGLAAVFATDGTASAAVVRTAIELATGPAGTAPAPVAALTEGVVRSMALIKFKVTAAVLLTACAIGFGAFAAAGSGADGGPPGPAPLAVGPVVPLAPVAAQPPKPVKEKKPALASDRERLQGTWRIVALTEGGKTTPTNPKDPWVIEVSGGTLKMPFLEGGSGSTASSGTTDTSGGASATASGTSGIGWKQREYAFAVDETKSPRTIDLIANQKPVAHGIFEFTLAAAQCASCHRDPFGVENTKLGEFLAVCAPVLKDQLKMDRAGVRLALSIDGKRPGKFGGDGVIVFDLKRPDPQDEERAKLVEAQKRAAAKLAAAASGAEKQRLEAELELLRRELDELIVREAQRQAEVELRQARAELERAKVQTLLAQVKVDEAMVDLQLAKARLVAAEKAVADAKKPRPGDAGAPDAGPVFTVHVRTLTAAEKVIRVKATGQEKVLEALVYAADDVSIKSDGVSVWVVRDKTVLPVDLPAITKSGDAKTNYALKPGDQLFVQAKPAK